MPNEIKSNSEFLKEAKETMGILYENLKPKIKRGTLNIEPFRDKYSIAFISPINDELFDDQCIGYVLSLTTKSSLEMLAKYTLDEENNLHLNIPLTPYAHFLKSILRNNFQINPISISPNSNISSLLNS